jgi:Na+-driven multidrug efflux pump
VLGSAMQGAGAPLRALLLDTCVVLLCQLPAALLVLWLPNRSLEHVWLGVAGSYLVLSLLFLSSYRRGRFLRTAAA